MKLSTPILDVVLENADGTYIEATIQTDNRDLVRWDLTRTKRQWPTVGDAPFLWGTFLAWAAMTRAGDIAEPFEDFQERCLQAKAKEVAESDPTQPAVESIS